MPAPIDRAKREQEIAEAAFRLLSERGPAALTLKALAAELGGSITLVTHVYANRAALLKGITDHAIADYDHELARLERGADDRRRLRILLEWMLPLTAEEQRRERGRVMLVAQRESDLNVNAFYVAMDRKMRQLLHDHLVPLLPPERIDAAVELLRTMANGVVLSVTERPTKWTRKRQLALLDDTLDLLGLR